MMGKSTTEVYWRTFVHPFFQNRPVYLASTTQGLCRITWPNESFDSLRVWVGKQIPNAVLVQNMEILSKYVRQLEEYFERTRKTFTLPVNLCGTAFQTSVWQVLTSIPYGQTRSYLDIAKNVGSPAAVRAVGAANGANPVPFIVPCHRVIGKGGALTGYRGGLQVKEKLLQMEGYDGYIREEYETSGLTNVRVT